MVPLAVSTLILFALPTLILARFRLRSNGPSRSSTLIRFLFPTLMCARVGLLSDGSSRPLDTRHILSAIPTLTCGLGSVRLLSDGPSRSLDAYTLLPHDSHVG